jgi:hypothetical protein
VVFLIVTGVKSFILLAPTLVSLFENAEYAKKWRIASENAENDMLHFAT